MGHKIFAPDGTEIKETQNFNQISPRGVAYAVGTIDIRDSLEATERGYEKYPMKKWYDYGLFKNTVLTIVASNKYGSAGVTGYQFLQDLQEAADRIDYSRGQEVQTGHSFRYFWQRIYAYNSSYVWQQVGECTNRYDYKHEYTRFFDKSVGEYRQKTKDFSQKLGYSPVLKRTSPNYMNYTKLSGYGREAYKTGRFYREGF